MNLENIHYEGLRLVLQSLEAASLNHLTISPALAPGGTATNFQVSAFSYMLGGVVYNKAAANNIAPPGAGTAAGEFRKVLVVIDSAGTITTVAGDVAEAQADAAIPATPAGKLAVGVIELPAEFVSGTTNVTAGMCKPYTHTVGEPDAA